MRPLLVGLIALAVFGALLLLNPVALASLAWAAATGRFGLRWQVAADVAAAMLVLGVAAAFLWHPALPARAKRKRKASPGKPSRTRRPVASAGAGKRRRRRSSA